MLNNLKHSKLSRAEQQKTRGGKAQGTYCDILCLLEGGGILRFGSSTFCSEGFDVCDNSIPGAYYVGCDCF